MNLYFIRHAEAVPTEPNLSDEDRPLTFRGVEQARFLASALQRKGIVFDLLVTSHLVRAIQTGDEISNILNFPSDKTIQTPLLSPEAKPKKLLRFLEKQSARSIALIGHQPSLGLITSWMIGSKKAQIEFDKAGIALVEMDVLEKGGGTLVWLLTPMWIVG